MTEVYMLLGQRICQHAFCAVLKLAFAIVNLLAVEVVQYGAVQKKPRLKKSRFGQIS